MDWKTQYQQLAHLNKTLLDQLQSVEYTKSRIRAHMEYCQRLDLNERNKIRYMKLKEDVKLAAEYQWGQKEEKLYPKGTLIDCTENGHVYLDDDGDGNLYFPTNLLEPVEVDAFDPTLDNAKIIHQG